MPCTSKVATYHPWFFLGFLPWIRVHALTSHALPALGVFSLKFCIFKGNIVIPIHISIQSYILKITTEVIDTSRCWIYINGTTTHGSIVVVVLGCCLFISYSYFQIESGTKQIFECGAWKNLDLVAKFSNDRNIALCVISCRQLYFCPTFSIK